AVPPEERRVVVKPDGESDGPIAQARDDDFSRWTRSKERPLDGRSVGDDRTGESLVFGQSLDQFHDDRHIRAAGWIDVELGCGWLMSLRQGGARFLRAAG